MHRRRIFRSAIVSLAAGFLSVACAPPGGGPVLTGNLLDQRDAYGDPAPQTHIVCTATPAKLRFVSARLDGIWAAFATILQFGGSTGYPLTVVSEDPATYSMVEETEQTITGCAVVILRGYAETDPAPSGTLWWELYWVTGD
ncbi:MAG TPA: hypothetical protein PKD80_14890 [Microthrixaceae bacterium]|nr:hypothetical protein [Microthrixaceae bacterium]HMT25866.1 hypothetical protein [Microthrixaceae bacterium]